MNFNIPVLFIDLFDGLIHRTESEKFFVNRALDLTALEKTMRLGILTNTSSGTSKEDIREILSQLDWLDKFEPDLINISSGIESLLPNAIAYKVAAAKADAEIEKCIFASCNATYVAGGLGAGMKAFQLNFEAGLEVTGTARRLRTSLISSGSFLKDKVDEYTGPTFILRGRIVAMKSATDVIDHGRLIISKGKIEKVLKPDEKLPDEFAHLREVDTKGTIYPGLFDLHNHFVYNVLPLWIVPQKYENRSQWPRHKEYKLNVSNPIKQVLAKYAPSAKALVRYVEAKALLSGTTTGQGILTRVQGGLALFRGAVRSVEETDDLRLPEARTRVPDLYVSGSSGASAIADFRKGLDDTEKRGASYFYHLSEGVDKSSRQHYLNLFENNLIRKSLVGIHSLGLNGNDIKALAENGAKVVWSPFSNLLLYGRTLNLKNLKDSGINFSIGCDWSPTGSKNLLQELKVAAFENSRQGNVFTDFELIEAVTKNAARVSGWHGALGSIQPGYLADLMVLEGDDGNPYEQMIRATEMDVKLVSVHGIVRYGDEKLVKELAPSTSTQIESWNLAGIKKAFYLFTEDSPINDVTFSGAIAELERAMSDLHAYRDEMESESARLVSIGMKELEESFSLLPDNEFYDNSDPLTDFNHKNFDTLDLFADTDEFAKSIPLDIPYVNSKEYWILVESQKNIPAELKEALKNFYT